jgi:LPXTG-site transpeptidase (sortase) family protein
MTLRIFNNGLSVIVIALGLYVSLSPFLPQLAYWFRDTSPEVVAPYIGQLAKDSGSDTDRPIPQDNRLVIPSIGVNESIKESTNIGVINSGGVWRRPKTANPIQEDNTVIVGHRYYGPNASTFYNLDKVSVGDKMAVYWDGEEIIYEVTETKIVDASQVSIEAATSEKQLTLYTCDPIWTAVNRLVIIAKPMNIQEANQL